VRALQTLQRRKMGGGHGGPPPTGWEAKVREVLPENHQVGARDETRAGILGRGDI
jgi:hypothetical protein